MPTAVIWTSPSPIAATMLSRSSSLSSTTSSSLTPRSTKPLMLAKASSSDLLAHRLLQEGERPQPHPALPAVVDRDDVDGDVAGGRVVLQAVEDHPAVHVGQPQVERDGGGLELPGQLQRRLALGGDHRLEAQLVGLVEQDARRTGARARRSGGRGRRARSRRGGRRRPRPSERDTGPASRTDRSRPDGPADRGRAVMLESPGGPGPAGDRHVDRAGR